PSSPTLSSRCAWTLDVSNGSDRTAGPAPHERGRDPPYKHSHALRRRQRLRPKKSGKMSFLAREVRAVGVGNVRERVQAARPAGRSVRRGPAEGEKRGEAVSVRVVGGSC